jgi:hypothetical protein
LVKPKQLPPPEQSSSIGIHVKSSFESSMNAISFHKKVLELNGLGAGTICCPASTPGVDLGIPGLLHGQIKPTTAEYIVPRQLSVISADRIRFPQTMRGWQHGSV